MYRYLFITFLIAVSSSLAALELIFPGGESLGFTPDKLRNETLQSFQTKRDKDGAMLTEKWSGIPLLPWLERIYQGSWQSLRVQSRDNYIVHLSCLELGSENCFLAIKNGDLELSEYDIRVIHTAKRESAWVRNLASITLEDFQPIPQPRQLLLWENWTKDNKALFTTGSLRLDEFMLKAFGITEGELLLVDSKMNRIRLEVSGEMANGTLELDGEGFPKLGGKAEQLGLSDLVYLQAGHCALISKTGLANLAKIGQELRWNWDGKYLNKVKTHRQRIETNKLPLSLPQGTWFELN
jgi:hypothetical protein